MNKELLRLKKMLLQANAPTREEQLVKALRVVFQSIGEDESPNAIYDGMSVEEAYKIIGWCD